MSDKIITRHLKWEVLTQPIPQKRHRHLKTGRTYDPCSAEKTLFLKKSRAACPEMVNVDSSPMSIKLRFECARPKSHYTTPALAKLSSRAPLDHTFKGDIDNYVKFVMDALCGTFYRDDAQIFQLSATKVWVSPGSERVSVELVSFSRSG